MDFSSVFNQYLKTTSIPELELRVVKNKLEYKWNGTIENFTMPIDISIQDKKIRLNSTDSWQKLEVKIKKLDHVKVSDDLFYINVKRSE